MFRLKTFFVSCVISRNALFSQKIVSSTSVPGEPEQEGEPKVEKDFSVRVDGN